MIERKDLSELAAIPTRKPCFSSPMAFKPYHSAEAVKLLLGTVMTVFQDFAYHRQFASLTGKAWCPIQRQGG